MDEKKFVTLEMFKKYHENLMGYIQNGDGLILEDLIADEEDKDVEDGE